MSTLVNKSINYKGGSVKITAQHNKRLSNCYVYMKFNTSENWLLNVLLQKFIHEKVLIFGCNMVNEIYNAVASPNGIMFACSEKKVLANIVNTLSYICKTKLNKKELDKLFTAEANYNKLHKDVKTFSVHITGKAVHLIRAFSNSDDKKIERFGEMLNNVQTKDFDTAKAGNREQHSVKFSGNAREKLDLSIVLEDAPFVFEKDEIIFLEPCPCKFINDYDYMQGKLKSFLVSAGSPGTPAANDTGATKHKAKCKYILECLNSMAYILSDLRGFSFKFSNIEEIQKGVLVESKAKIRDCLKAFSK